MVAFRPLTPAFQRMPAWVFSLAATMAAFSVYSCMYAFRRPFAAATFEGADTIGGVDYKVWLVTAQVLGYMLSKFLGIRLVAEMKQGRRALWVLGIIAIAQAALLGFGAVPAPWNIGFMFLNGLPLGMVWGIVFSYLEGRRYTDFMGAGLCASFILASGFVKSIGGLVMRDWGVSEYWMPFVTGGLFALPLVLALWVLDQLPPPTPADEALRTRREPMDAAARRRLLAQMAPGLLMLIVVYMLISALRDFRDNFMANLLGELGYAGKPELFTLTELPIGLGVLVLLAGMMFIRNNHTALLLNHVAIAVGCALSGLSTMAFHAGALDPVVWVVLVGFGLYLAYVPFNAFLFDRLLAAFRFVGTASFLIMVADSFGYLASVAVLFAKNFGPTDLSWLQFFKVVTYWVAVLGVGLAVASGVYFYRKGKTTPNAAPK